VNESNYRRRRWTYTFRAWIDEQGWNRDREHETRCGNTRSGYCRHIRLWDLNRRGSGKNLVRMSFRRRPFYLSIGLGRKYRGINIGRLSPRFPC
jgi:hypothetical protein